MQHTNRHIARILQLSDSHLGPGRDFKLAGINTCQSLGQVLSALPGPDVVPELLAVTGDIAGDGDEGAYHLFNEVMAEQPRPFAWLPGNHDDFPLMRKVLHQSFRRVIELDNWVAIFLVSAQSGEVAGQLADAELAELAGLLHRYRDRHVLLFMHHMPVEISCLWLDKHRVANHRQLADLVAGFPGVKALFAGHVHQAFSTSWQGIGVHSAPSTCFQFAPGSDGFELAEQPPGYRWIDLYADGHLKTGEGFVAGTGQQVDHRCSGY